MALRKYTVTWAEDVLDALTPREAAVTASKSLFGALWYGRVAFTVTGEDGHTSRIDLNTDEKFSPAATEALR